MYATVAQSEASLCAASSMASSVDFRSPCVLTQEQRQAPYQSSAMLLA